MTSEADGWVKNLFKNGEPEPILNLELLGQLFFLKTMNLQQI
jgi:hypothetical protein